MLLERHLGQERSLSSPRSTCSWYSWPHIMQRNVSVVAMADSLPYGAAAVAASALGFGFFFGLGLRASFAFSISSSVTV